MILNFDILLVIMSHLPFTGDIFLLMRTCHTLYSPGVPILLSRGVKLNTPRKLAHFYKFMSADAGNRYNHLRVLAIDIAFFQHERYKRMFLNVLRRAHKLEDLSVLDSDLLTTDTRFPTIIAKLTSLKVFTLAHYGSENFEPANMLSLMLSKLVKATIDFCEFEDPIDRLANSASSLEELDAVHVYFEREDVQYTKMKTLCLEFWRVAEIGPLIHSYPNLCTLEIQGYSANESYLVNAVVDRATNQAFQLQKSWKMLDSVHANIVELYALAINCKIHSLNVADGLYNIQHIEMLCAILADCRPSILHIHCMGFKTERFPDIPSIPSELVEVDLQVNLEELSTSDELDRFLVSMLSVLRY
ncbi:hypothetical protein EW026_g7333 [Hermanssonia centrifuga]|uniref:F-box domain-containing protein n=1 Tax=Hermanssonia centrifuga TaxID=98765 RepID=A0A4S4K864_9APHY|nr:hypothetical protein EW026_g7333 [Hermanssonia centrifuga]